MARFDDTLVIRGLGPVSAQWSDPADHKEPAALQLEITHPASGRAFGVMIASPLEQETAVFFSEDGCPMDEDGQLLSVDLASGLVHAVGSVFCFVAHPKGTYSA